MNNEQTMTELLIAAARACRAWHIAEEKYLGTFNERSELASYSEWLTRKALAAVDGVPFDEPYQGVPYMYLTLGGVHLERASEAEAAALAESVEGKV